MPIVLAGATSGSATLQATDAQTVTITMPATSGTLVTTGGAQTIEFADGSASAPSITNSGDTNTGMFFPAADTIAFTEGGVESMRIDASGNVGIGGTSAGDKLNVFRAAGNSNGGLTLTNTDNSGYGSALTWNLKLNSTAGEWGRIYTEAASTTATFMAFQTTVGSTLAERMRIDSSGNVGIGTTSIDAGYRLSVVGGGIISLKNQSGTAFHTTNAVNADYSVITTSGGVTNTGTTGNALAFTTGSERMRIPSGNGVRIAMENYANAPSSTNFGVEINNTNASSTFFGQGTGTESQITFGNRNGVRGSIQTNATNTLYNTTSDYRLKENVAPMIGALAKVSQLNPCTYTWKVDGSDGQGFIAHELQAVIPDAVTGEKDGTYDIGNIIGADGNIVSANVKEPHNLEEGLIWAKTGSEPKYQMVDTSFLVATLTAAIQELKATVDAQAARIAALEGAK